MEKSRKEYVERLIVRRNTEKVQAASSMVKTLKSYAEEITKHMERSMFTADDAALMISNLTGNLLAEVRKMTLADKDIIREYAEATSV